MEVIRDLDGGHILDQGSVVTMGNYDGVHRGHRAVIAELTRRVSGGGATALITYEPHTLVVIRPDIAPKLLTPTERKLELLAETGLDYACVLTFDEERSRQEPEDFVAEIIAGCLRAREVVVGADARFGHKARGDLALLRELGPRFGFAAHHLDLLVTDGREKISSTRIRQALARGDVEWAGWALERAHEVAGAVVPGDRRGASLGFPTANVDVPPDICLPGDGVYAGWVRLGGEQRSASGGPASPPGPAFGQGAESLGGRAVRPRPRAARVPTVVNVGRRPTFYEHADRSLVEAHLFDFEDDIYGEHVVVEFHHRIRPELRFDGAAELVEWMRRDAEQARRLLRV